MAEEDFSRLNIAVLLPCYNEGKSIAAVVIGFRKALPAARIYVYDNNSSDDTSAQAAFAGATVVPSRRQGKGNVVRQMFADIEADVYLMADGDGTYDPAAAPRMIDTLLADRVDMVVGTRRNVTEDAGRNGHAFGNRLFNMIYRTLFGSDFTDIFSGYRAFTRRFAKSFPASSPGFEIETEMSVHASTLRLPVSEIEFDYGRRVEGSESKLSTFRDGFRILRMMGMLVKETRPFLFFSSVAAGLFGLAAILSVPVLAEYLETGLVSRMPTWMLAMTLLLGAMMSFTAGVILDSLSRSRIEQKRIHYLSIAPARGDTLFRGTGSVADRRDTDDQPAGPSLRKTGA
ncbi:glycosyltransferase [Hyphomonas sp.]|jgi:glycosyltransferase involved in cell wall biosynthesis|uniref:glycosyltransferase n=1 Tax=Hyphomonas sp. TaxID=87 RepID=UPI0032D8F489